MTEESAICFRETCLLLTIAAIVSALEFLYSSSLFGDGGLLSWRLRQASPYGKGPQVHMFFSLWFDRRGTKLIFIFRILSATALAISILAYHCALADVFLLCLFFAQITIAYRCPIGGDGADQMFTVCCAGMAFVGLFHLHSKIYIVGYYFIALQSCLSYFAAGIAKLFSKSWRTGNAVPQILSTFTYGRPSVGLFLSRSPVIGLLLSWGAMIFECVFPVALLAPPKILLGLILGGICFHVANAFFMGLNGFVWSFLATYPSLIFVDHQLRSL